MVTLVTARELAEALNVSTETILRWSRRGQLPALKLPSGAIRYRPSALEEWLAARELQKDDEPAGNGLEATTSAVTATDDDAPPS